MKTTFQFLLGLLFTLCLFAVSCVSVKTTVVSPTEVDKQTRDSLKSMIRLIDCIEQDSLCKDKAIQDEFAKSVNPPDVEKRKDASVLTDNTSVVLDGLKLRIIMILKDNQALKEKLNLLQPRQRPGAEGKIDPRK